MGIEVALLAVAIGATATSYSQSRKAASAARQQSQIQQRMADMKAARERRDAVRQARIARAEIEQLGASTGTSGSSGVAGGVGSVQSQLGYNLSFLDNMQSMSGQASIFAQKQITAETNAQTASSIASTAWGSGGSTAASTIFSKKG